MISLTVEGQTSAEFLANLQATAGGLAGAPGTSGNPGTPGVTTDYFPTDPTVAPFPSPGNSTMTVLNGVIGGEPYLKDANGAIYQFVKGPVAAGVGWEATINGALIGTGAGASPPAAPEPVFQMIVRNGGVYFQTSNGQGWGYSKSGLVKGWSIVSLPAETGGSPQPLPTMPPDPPATSPIPGSGDVILAGPSQTFKTLAAAVAAAVAGDTITLDAGAVFAESVELTVPLLINGQGKVANPGSATASFSGGAIIDGSTFTTYALGKGGLVLGAGCIIRGCEVRGFGLKESTTGGTAGIRTTDTAAKNVVIDNCYVHDNQDGVSEGGTPNISDWTITNSLFANNGIGDGLSHNIYVEGVRLTMSGVTSIVKAQGPDTTRITGSAGGGHALKTRSNALAISGTNYFYASDAAPIDIPDGTTQPFSIAAGTTIAKAAVDANHGVLDYCAESVNNGAAGGTVIAVFDALCARPFVNINGGKVDFTGSTLGTGVAMTAVGAGTVVALP